jgi:hypothetical protein
MNKMVMSQWDSGWFCCGAVLMLASWFSVLLTFVSVGFILLLPIGLGLGCAMAIYGLNDLKERERKLAVAQSALQFRPEIVEDAARLLDTEKVT